MLAKTWMLTIVVVGLLGTSLANVDIAGQAPDSRAERLRRETDNAALQNIAPFKVFDNLYYVGVGYVGSWLVTTNQGLILIDTLEGAYKEHPLEGIRKLGFDPANIKYLFKLLTNPFGDMLTTGTISDVDGNGKVNFYYVSRDDTALVDIEYQGGNKADSANYTVKYYRIPKRDGYGKLGESYWDLCTGLSVVEMSTMDLDADGKREIVISTWHPNILGTSQAGFLVFESSKPVTSVESKQVIPQRYELSQNYPNPFNPSTTIRFTLAKTGKATLVVTDVLGREVARLIDGVIMAGAHSIQFDTSDLTSGIYLYTLKTENFAETKRMVVLH